MTCAKQESTAAARRWERCGASHTDVTERLLSVVIGVYIARASCRRCCSAQPRQLAGHPAAHRAQDLDAHALAQAQLLEVGVEADLLLGPVE